MRYNIETKLTPSEPELTLEPRAFAGALLSIIESAGVATRTTVQSFDWRTLVHIRETRPTIRTACLTHEAPDNDTIQRGREGASPWTAGLDIDAFAGSVPDLVAAAGCSIWSPHYADLDRSEVERAHAIHIEVIPWTVNEPNAIQSVMDLGVDGLISDTRRDTALMSHGPIPLVGDVAGIG
jgi:glycerophosphoryl diester phosphodiesterase